MRGSNESTINDMGGAMLKEERVEHFRRIRCTFLQFVG